MIKNEQIDGNKEMIAFGMMNIVGSFTSCYLTTGTYLGSNQPASALQILFRDRERHVLSDKSVTVGNDKATFVVRSRALLQVGGQL